MAEDHLASFVRNASGGDGSSDVIIRTIPELIVGTLTLGVIMVITITGNILVIMSICTYRPLKKVQNFFLVSLAVADLSVAIIVLPYGIVYFIANRWLFGRIFCQIWLTFDVLLCTSSILNLCAIALDRYWAIHDPINYSNKRTLNLVLFMVGTVWTISTLISLPPLVGWNNWDNDNEEQWDQCAYTTEPGFIVYSACGSFFIPLVIMTVVYLKIFCAARSRLRKRVNDTTIRRQREDEQRKSQLARLIQTTLQEANSNNTQLTNHTDAPSTDQTKPMLPKPKVSNEPDESSNQSTEDKEGVEADDNSHSSNSPTTGTKKQKEGATVVASLYSNPTAILVTTMTHINHPALNELKDLRVARMNMMSSTNASRRRSLAANQHLAMQNFFKEREKISVSKEKKAAKTLAIIMGVFVLCWLPFFCLYVIMPLCPNKCGINDRIFEATNWLGYINSALNPVIYTIFNLDFRKAFKKLLSDFRKKICCVFSRNRQSSA